MEGGRCCSKLGESWGLPQRGARRRGTAGLPGEFVLDGLPRSRGRFTTVPQNLQGLHGPRAGGAGGERQQGQILKATSAPVMSFGVVLGYCGAEAAEAASLLWVSRIFLEAAGRHVDGGQDGDARR